MIKRIIFGMLCGITTGSIANDIGDSNLIEFPDRFYEERWDNNPIPVPLWKREYTAEERKAAKPIIIQAPDFYGDTYGDDFSATSPKSFDLKTKTPIVTPDKEILPYLDQLKNNEDFPEEYDQPGNVGLESTPGADSTKTEDMFSNRLVFDTTNYPNAPVVKIWFTKPGVSGSWICSGALVDPSVVLTSAHCVHDGNFNWYSRFNIIPAYNQRDRSSIINEKPFGSTYATVATAWGYSFVPFNMGSDIAMLRLNRPVGTLTGWLGYGTGTYCDILTDNDYTTAGYPGHDTRSDHCLVYDGSQMVTAHGTFDYCSNGMAYTYSHITCGGQSGSNYWDTSGYHTRATVTGYTGRDEGIAAIIDRHEFDEIKKFENNSLTSTPNLAALGTKVNGSLLGRPEIKVQPGANLQDLRFRLVNMSNTSFSGTVIANFYLSTNKTISNTDVSLGTYKWSSINLNSKKGANLYLNNPPKIPATTPTGYYFIGVQVNGVPGEVELTNNITGFEDVAIVQNVTTNIPSYSSSTNYVTIPIVNVDGHAYSATMRLESSNPPFLFTLRTLVKIDDSNIGKEGTARYTSHDQILHLPKLLVNGREYEARLYYTGNGWLKLTYLK
jgi:V8-like Glu-specific endopeptidase